MSGAPTLVVRFALSPGDHFHLGRDCHTVAKKIATGEYRRAFPAMDVPLVVDAQWSHPVAEVTPGTWPRRPIPAADRKLVEACELLVEQYIPDTFTHELLRIVREVSK